MALDNIQGVLVQRDIGKNKEMMMLVARQPVAGASRTKLPVKIAMIVGFAALLNYGGQLVVGKIEIQLWPEVEPSPENRTLEDHSFPPAPPVYSGIRPSRRTGGFDTNCKPAARHHRDISYWKSKKNETSKPKS